jgi:hypothetical protein
MLVLFAKIGFVLGQISVGVGARNHFRVCGYEIGEIVLMSAVRDQGSGRNPIGAAAVRPTIGHRLAPALLDRCCTGRAREFPVAPADRPSPLPRLPFLAASDDMPGLVTGFRRLRSGRLLYPRYLTKFLHCRDFLPQSDSSRSAGSGGCGRHSQGLRRSSSFARGCLSAMAMPGAYVPTPASISNGARHGCATGIC